MIKRRSYDAQLFICSYACRWRTGESKWVEIQRNQKRIHGTRSNKGSAIRGSPFRTIPPLRRRCCQRHASSWRRTCMTSRHLHHGQVSIRIPYLNLHEIAWIDQFWEHDTMRLLQQYRTPLITSKERTPTQLINLISVIAHT